MTETPDFVFPFLSHNSDVLGGDQFLFRFHNNLGASIIRHRGSYGHELGLWELAAIEWNGDEWDFYHNDFYEDVKGWQTESDLNHHLRTLASYRH